MQNNVKNKLSLTRIKRKLETILLRIRYNWKSILTRIIFIIIESIVILIFNNK